MPDVAVARIDLFARRSNGDMMFLGVGDRVFATPDVPFTPWRNYREIRGECGVGKLEANLIVPLAGASVGEGSGTHAARDLDLATRNERPSHRSTEKIFAAVNGSGAERRPDEVFDELLTEVFD